MARVFIDAHMFGEAWFKEVIKELIKCKRVSFSYGEIDKLNTEISRVRKALEFFKIARELRDDNNKSRRVDASPQDMTYHEEYIKRQNCFTSCNDCDDPHVFALIYAKPTPYVFSMDKRMAKCRDTINTAIDSRYCNFIIVSSDSTYRTHKHAILA